MPLASRSRLVLLEIAAGAALVAFTFKGVWLPVGAVVALVSAALALVTVHRRPLYAVTRSWIGLRLRRSGRSRHNPAHTQADPQAQPQAQPQAHPHDQFRVVTVPSAGRGAAVGVIQGDQTWSVPLAMPLNGLLNEDAPLDLDRVAALLHIEGVRLANVRVVTISWPAMPGPEALVGAHPRPLQRASRHLVLTLDTAYAAEVIVERGGPAAINQILRRCVLRAEELLRATGVEVTRLSEMEVAAAAAGAVGRTPNGPDVRLMTSAESLSHVDLADSTAHTFVVTGPDSLARLPQLAQAAPAPVVATSVVLEPGATGRGPMVTVLIRISGAADVVNGAVEPLKAAGARLGLHVDPVLGAQLPLLQATTLLGVARESAA